MRMIIRIVRAVVNAGVCALVCIFGALSCRLPGKARSPKQKAPEVALQRLFSNLTV